MRLRSLTRARRAGTVTGVRGVLILAVVLASCACSSPSGRSSTSHAPSSVSVTTASAPLTTTTAQATGFRTVLSPIGLNVRAQPSKAATILRTAAQGAVFTVLAHTDQGGGWFEVKGPTVTGWISDNPALSASGRFNSYSSTQHQLDLLYPDGWTVAESPPASVIFHASSGNDTLVVTTAATVDQLGRGRAGYHQTSSEQVVVCGVTSDLVTFVQVNGSAATPQPGGVVPQRYLGQVNLTLDAQHALGIDANLADTAQLPTFRSVVNSVTFPFPQCRPTGA
jgi:SH3 domain-containing protein